MLGSPAYTDTLEALFDTVEGLLSGIFDAAYVSVRQTYDDPAMQEDDSDEGETIDPDKELPQELKDLITSKIGQEVDKQRSEISDNFKNVLGRNLSSKSELIDAISDKIVEILASPTMSTKLNDFGAYVFQSFYIKLPLQQMAISRNKTVSDQSDYTPDRKLEMKDPVEYQRRKDDFNEKNASQYNGAYRGEFNWQSILSKESGIGLTTNASFSPAVHNKTYGDCKSCKDKKTSCGCDE